jgi:DNA-directed RNA polymerase specialized sigma24 family protein
VPAGPGDPGEAQDATHDAPVQAWRKWETLRDPARSRPWFDRILRLPALSARPTGTANRQARVVVEDNVSPDLKIEGSPPFTTQ